MFHSLFTIDTFQSWQLLFTTIFFSFLSLCLIFGSLSLTTLHYILYSARTRWEIPIHTRIRFSWHKHSISLPLFFIFKEKKNLISFSFYSLYCPSIFHLFTTIAGVCFVIVFSTCFFSPQLFPIEILLWAQFQLQIGTNTLFEMFIVCSTANNMSIRFEFRHETETYSLWNSFGVCGFGASIETEWQASPFATGICEWKSACVRALVNAVILCGGPTLLARTIHNSASPLYWMWSVQCAGRTSNSWSFSCKRKQNRWFRCGDTLSVYMPSTKIPMHADYSCHLPILHLLPQTAVAGADFFSVISFF